MTNIYHLNCLIIETPGNGNAIGHCLLLQDEDRLALVDTGIGLQDTMHPEKRIGQDLIEMVGFKFNENQTAVRQIEKLDFMPSQVKHCILTHLDPDHASGLVDFSNIQVHVSTEELNNFESGNPRYLPIQLAHKPEIVTYGIATEKWFGLEARKLKIDFSFDIFLIALPGHTLGHCGVAVNLKNKWTLHIGNAYYLKAETEMNDHPVTQLATLRADDNNLRIESLNQIKRLLKDHSDEIDIFGYHDPSEFYLSNN